MLTWVMYDIPKDKVRNKIAKACQEAGIFRVQYSVFLGDLDKAQRKELQIIIEELIDEALDSVYIFPMSEDDFNQCVLLGQAFDKDLITDELKALLL